jgi:hypothetical protein
MDLLATSKTLLGTVHDLYAFINANKTLRKRYGEALNTLILLRLLLQRVTSSSRIPEEAEPCLAEIQRTLERTNVHLRRRVRASKRTGFWLKAMVWVWNDDFERINKQIETLTTRLELLLQLKEVLDNESRFDASKILEDVGQEARDFWDHHFGSETLTVPIGTFLQSMELAENRRLQHAEREVVSTVLDPDQDGSVSVYEFARWLRHFGPVHDAMATTLTSIFDAKHNRVHGWFHQDLFWDGVVKLIDGQPGNCIVRYGVGETMFIIDVCDSNGNIHEICVARENGAFRPVLCSDESDMRTDDEDKTPAWLLRAMRIVTDKMEFTFDTIPEILKCLADVILFHPTHVESQMRRQVSAAAPPRAAFSPERGGERERVEKETMWVRRQQMDKFSHMMERRPNPQNLRHLDIKGSSHGTKGFSYTAPARGGGESRDPTNDKSIGSSTLSSPRQRIRQRSSRDKGQKKIQDGSFLMPTAKQSFPPPRSHRTHSDREDEDSSLHVSPSSTPKCAIQTMMM